MDGDGGMVEKAKKGDQESFVFLFDDVKQNLYITALAILKNGADAEDALQDTCLSAYTSISRLSNPAYYKTWITRILINACVKIKRKHSNVCSFEDGLTAEAGGSFSAEGIELWDMLGKLPEKDKKIVVLRYFSDRKIEEIAEILHCPVNTVKSRLYRSIEKLKKAAGGECVE